MMYVKTSATSDHLCMMPLGDAINCCGNTYTMDQPIGHIIPFPNACSAYVITDKSVLIYNVNVEKEYENELIPTDIEWRQPCCHVEAVNIDSKNFIVAQSYSNCLLIDGKEVANNITSFYVHSDFLLLTTLQHTLICIPLNESSMEQLKKHDLTVKPWELTDKTLFAGEDFAQSLFSSFHEYFYFLTLRLCDLSLQISVSGELKEVLT